MSPLYMFLLGVLIGAAYFPSRLTGIDFRQWVHPDRPYPVNEFDDNSWIGLFRGTCITLAWSLIAAIVAGYLIVSLSGQKCLLSANPDCSRWREVLALVLGAATMQLLASARWQRVLDAVL